MKRFLPVLKVLVLVAAIVCVCFAADALAKGGGPLGGCPRDINCLDVWNPVWCDQGVFSNACYAFRACATNCGGAGS